MKRLCQVNIYKNYFVNIYVRMVSRICSLSPRGDTMSPPSVANTDITSMSQDELERALYKAIKKDLPLAFDWFQSIRPGEHMSENPSSVLAGQIKRIVAADALRHVMEKFMFDGEKIVFANCCDVIVSPPKGFDPVRFQFETQNGVLNRADC